MRHVPLSEFKDKASEIIAAAESGEDVVITRHGREVVRLVGIEQDRVQRQQAAFDAMARVRRELQSDGVQVSLDEMIAWKNEGRP